MHAQEQETCKCVQAGMIHGHLNFAAKWIFYLFNHNAEPLSITVPVS